MKYIALFARILVGLEFVFSGFVKVVDPYGTGLKLQEYFEVFAEDLPGLAPFFHMLADNAQPLSLVFCSVELILGVALLLVINNNCIVFTGCHLVRSYAVHFQMLHVPLQNHEHKLYQI